MSQDELKARARELERAGNTEEAWTILIKLAGEAPNEALAGARSARAGALQLASGDEAGAAETLSRAVDLFETAGQVNNAIAVCQKLARIAGDPASARARLTSLAMASDYQNLARRTALEVAATTSQVGAGESAVAVAGDFATHYSEDTEFVREWADAITERLGSLTAVELLDRLGSRVDGNRCPAISAAVRQQVARLDPSRPATPSRVDESSAYPWLAEGGDETSSIEFEQLDPAFIGPGPVAAGDDEAIGLAETIPRIEGLEPTLVSLTEPDDLDLASLEEAIPILNPAGQASANDSVGLVDPEDDPGDGGEPLPLLAPARQEEIVIDAPGDATDLVTPPEFDTRDSDGEADLAAPLPLLGDPAAANLGFDLDPIRRELDALPGREIDPADPATHYDLGLAFKEMGIADVAIAQLTAAIQGGYRPVASLEILGEILLDRGDHDRVERILRPVVDAVEPADPERVGVLYWLARASESLGAVDDARDLFARVVDVDPAFRDASDRLSNTS